jgi:hypothetical protein
VPIVLKSGSLILQKPVMSRPVIGLLYHFSLILREIRLDVLLRFLSYAVTKYNFFSAESISALNTQVWEECFIYNYSALCGIHAFQTIHNLHVPCTGPSALSFLQLCNAIYSLIYKDGTSQVLFISSVILLPFRAFLMFLFLSLYLRIIAFPFTQKYHF